MIVIVIGMFAALTTLSVPSARGGVSADHADCLGSENPVQTANSLLKGVYTFGNIGQPRNLGLNLTWTENPFKDDNWQSYQHGLRWTLNLTQAALTEDSEAYETRLFQILKDWEADNPRPGAKSKWAWSDHTTAGRSIVLVCVKELLDPAGDEGIRIDRMLKKHGDTLLEDGFYVKLGNHALDQSIALLEVGRTLKSIDPGRSAAFMDKAEKRLNEYVGRSVDEQGVMNEQSVGYQYFNYYRYNVALGRLDAAGADAGQDFERVDRMPNFLAHATLPNGRYEMIGDTQDIPAITIPGTIAEYAATRGARGPKPDRTVARFNAGYLFARSGWGATGGRGAADHTFFSTKWGPAPILHGHNDGMSLTLASWGSRLLIDSGLYRYGNNPFRIYMKSRPAHNVVTVDGATWNDKARSGRVIDNTLVSDKYVDLQLRMAGYPGVTHTRRITYSRALDYLIVDDQLASSERHTYRQLWHLGWDADPVVSGTKVQTRRGPKGNLLIAQLHGRPTSRIVRGSTSPIQGWTSYKFAKLNKTPTVEAIQTGRSVRYITLLAPAKYQPKPIVKSLRAFPGGYKVTLKIGSKTETLTVYGKKVTVR